MADSWQALAQTSVRLTVSPVVFAVALFPHDPAQLQTAVSLSCGQWGGIRFPWLPLADDGTVVGGAEKLCEILDVAGIVDLAASDDMAPPPAGLAALRPQAAPNAADVRTERRLGLRRASCIGCGV
jgi:hypothetical protein